MPIQVLTKRLAADIQAPTLSSRITAAWLEGKISACNISRHYLEPDTVAYMDTIPSLQSNANFASCSVFRLVAVYRGLCIIPFWVRSLGLSI